MSRCFVIAEGGVNHNGSVERALAMVEAAARAGADAIKFQTFRAESLIAASAPMADYQVRNTGQTRSQRDMVRELELDVSALPRLRDAALAHGIEFMSTPFDLESLDLLLDLGMQRVKLSSGDLTHVDYLFEVARRQKPVILSTGMADMGEIESALAALALGYLAPQTSPDAMQAAAAYRSAEGQAVLRDRVTLLHCTTEYPAPLAAISLRAMDTLSAAFGLPVGYSDHSLGLTVSVAAAARDAVLVEKHFTLDRELPGPDHRASLDVAELTQLVRAIRDVKVALGSPRKAPADAEIRNRAVARRSLVTLRPIRAGEPFNRSNLGCKRPGSGVPAIRYWEYLGRVAHRDYGADELIDA